VTEDRERIESMEAHGPPETDPRIEGEQHPVAKMIGWGLLASAIGVAITLWIDWFPEDATGSAGQIDTLYDVLLICSVPIFVLVMTIAIYSVVRFRAKPGDMGDGPPIHGNTRLEVIWVTIPFIMVALLAVYGWVVLDDIEAKQENELRVQVTGQQFTWTFAYPSEDNLKTRELVLPVDRPVDFRIRTNDVLHSFWVPQFRLKSDAVPGLTTSIRLTPDKEGRYEVVCAELCGIGHAAMRQFVRVVPESEWRSWVREQQQAAGGGDGGGEPAEEQGADEDAAGAAGEQIFSAAGCAGCHALAAAGSDADVGPDLGQLSQANARFVRESIVNPNAEVAEGFQEGVMPENFGEQLSDEELDALVKYLLEAQE
jgi:cytochrome c oxidase subunit 2